MALTRSCVSISPRVYVYQTSIFHSPRDKCSFMRSASLKSLRTCTDHKKVVHVVAHANLGPQGPPSDSSPNSWKLWILGAIMSAVLPFLGNKFGPLLKLKNEVEIVMETAEHIVEVVEKVAEEVEKVAEVVSDQLPDGGRLKNALIFVENVAKETAKDAHLVEDVLDKVEEVEKEVDSFFDGASGKTKL